MPTKVLLDTDIDILGDIDDAMCLAYLLAQSECELLGITTVTWDTAKRARVASAMCKAAGKDVPIFPGARSPLLAALPVFPASTEDSESAFLEGWEHDTVFPEGRAVEFLRHTIRAHPGEVVLLGIGPFTNIALLFAVDPAIPALLKGLVLMAGNFAQRVPDAPLREWNALLDPHAAAMVYRAAAPQHRSVGLDVTHELRMDTAHVLARLGGGSNTLLHAMATLWSQKSPSITFHDPLAAATIFDERLCDFRRGTVEVELTSERLVGLTHWTPGDLNAPHEVALEVDQAAFFEHYFSVISL